ncbi:MAG: competence/damage-inducible protein A [Gemmatimonadota bacterium]
MNIEVVTIGTELLLGFTVDTNGVEIGQALAEAGVRVCRRTSVADQAEAIRDAVSAALGRTGAVLTTGGLGPTRDDITKKCLADLFGARLEFQEKVWQELLQRMAKYGRVPSESNRSQAEVPRGAIVLPNPLGTAPGIWLEGSRGFVIMLPGVPSEMRGLLINQVVPRLRARAGGSVIRSMTLRTTAIPESSLAELLGNIEKAIHPLTLAYLPGLEGVDLRVTAWETSPEIAADRLGAARRTIMERAGPHIYGEGEADLAALVLDRARQASQRIAVAESCTGGMIGERLTAVPGSSDAFVGGVIAYENAVKIRDLGVPAELIATHGAVSQPVVEAMVKGVASRFNTGLAMAVTGIAGPSGATADKPVGLVWYATMVRDKVESSRYVFPGPRENVRARATQATLFQLFRGLDGSEGLPA